MISNHPFRHLHFTALLLMLVGLTATAQERNEQRIRMDATINGKTAHLIYDTGASTLILFAKGATRLGLSFTNAPKDVPAKPGVVAFGTTELCDWAIGNSHGRESFPIVEIPAMLHLSADGVIGWGAVNSNITLIDAGLGTVTCFAKLPPETATWIQCKLRTNFYTMQFESSASTDAPYNILVDTGASGGVELSEEKWQSWKKAHKNDPMTLMAHYTPHAGLVITEEAWAKELSFGRFSLTDVAVMESDHSDSKEGITATWGLSALKRVDMIVDGPKGILYLRPSNKPAPPYEHNRLGAVFTPVDLQTSDDLIAHVITNSPAYNAGIRNGDVLLKIDTLDVTKWRTDPNVLPLTRFWERPAGSNLKLELRRGGEKTTVDVVLQQILSPGTNTMVKPTHK
ncbi:MAG: pdz domain [Verrucomicrobiales bacterium]|nr:pdz domain [Verrucomicrobiales bacterium]